MNYNGQVQVLITYFLIFHLI